MNSHSSFKNACEKRLPFLRPLLRHFSNFPMPPVTWMWSLGACLLITLFLMIISGLFLALNYQDSPSQAFHSLEAIERRLPSGWFIHALHQGGASMFFIALYGHIARSIWYGSYKAPREFVWLSGLCLFMLFMITAFAGYVLPWGQMSYWAATVIFNALHSIPLIGDLLTNIIFGENHIRAIALHHLFIYHLFLGALSLAIIIFHILSLHSVGSTNPTQESPNPVTETKPFHPYYTSKESLILCIFLFIYTIMIFFLPDYFNKIENLIPANPMKTPPHISPEWYLAPYFAILKAVPSRLGGLVIAASSLLILFAFPWLDRSPYHHARYRPMIHYHIVIFFLSFITLIAAGLHDMTTLWLWLSRIAIILYFFIPLCVFPWNAKKERKKSTNICSRTTLKLLAILLINSAFLPSAFAQRDENSVKRGFQVFQQICSACHGMQEAHYSDMLDFTHLSTLKNWAKTRQNAEIDAPITSPYPSVKIAINANGGDFPPDMSHLAGTIKGGSAYIEAMLQGYRTPPANMDMGVHNYYNPIALARHKHFRMPPPLHDNMLAYDDGTPATTAQMAHDVTAFLVWANNPHKQKAHFVGSFILIYLAIMAIILFFLKKEVWRDKTENQ